MPLMSGFPSAPDFRVTLLNWQDPPFNRWSFQHLRELIPTQRIPRGTGPVNRLAYDRKAFDPAAVEVQRVDGSTGTIAEVLADTWTDAAIILHGGHVVFEHYENSMTPDTPHLMMSVTKSVVGCVAGVLADRGILDTDELVSAYVPEISTSGYGGAKVRDLLDMRSGVAFSEEYTNPDAEVRTMERFIGWRPGLSPGEDGGLYAYLATLGTSTAHGGSFVYRSADTNMLGWVCERAANTRMADMISELIWQPMGAEFDAEISCDGVGSAIHDGGLSARARDMARFGQLLLEDGYVGDTPVVPQRWLSSARTLDPDIRGAFSASPSEAQLSGGWYRNQFWFVPGPLGDLQLCLGIHGQMVLVDRATRTVAVKMSTWPAPQWATYLFDTIRAFAAAGQHLAGLTGAGRKSSHATGPIGVVEGRERGQS